MEYIYIFYICTDLRIGPIDTGVNEPVEIANWTRHLVLNLFPDQSGIFLHRASCT